MFFLPISDDVCTIVNASEVIRLDPQNFLQNPLFSELESIEVGGKVLIFQGVLGNFVEKLVKSCFMMLGNRTARPLCTKSRGTLTTA